MSSAIGRPVDRADAPAKVTGGARYAGDIALPGLVHAALVGAAIPKGHVTAVEATAAAAADGVLAVLTHENLPRIAGAPHLLPSLVGGPAPGESFFPMQDDAVHYAGQPVAIVVADTHERAQHAASLLAVSYAHAPSITTIDEGRGSIYEPEKLFGGLMPARNERGDVEAGLAAAEVRVDAAYRIAANHHNALEPPTTTAIWDGDRLTLHDSTMGVRAVQLTVAQLLGMPLADVRVLGALRRRQLRLQGDGLAARHARRHGRAPRRAPRAAGAHAPAGVHRAGPSRGAGAADRARRHARRPAHRDPPREALGHLAVRRLGRAGDRQLVRALRLRQLPGRPPAGPRQHDDARRSRAGPGETVGSFVLETAMDELAHAVAVDPLELRVRDHAAADPHGNPWSSDGLEECLRRGAERFGWADRDPAPRARRDGDWLLGHGMAAASYPVPLFMPAQHARARVYADGSAVVETGTAEFGTGVGTIMTQVGADALGLPLEAVGARTGDTDLPNTSSPVGSAGATMVSAAVHAAGLALRDRLVALAVGDDGSPLHGADPATITVEDGRMATPDGTGETYGELLARRRMTVIEADGTWRPPPLDTPHGLLTFGAQFAEVAVDPELGLVRVRRLVGAFAPGRVLNPKLARSQLMGGMLWGLGQALLEGNRMDARHGRWGASNLAEYLVPVNADAPDVEVVLVPVEDRGVNPLGVKGVGEIGMVGVAAAIANAIFNATGRRLRELPMAPELVMDPPAAAA